LFWSVGCLESQHFLALPLCLVLGEGEGDAADPLPLRFLCCEGDAFSSSLLGFLPGDGDGDGPDLKEDDSSDVSVTGTLGFAPICERTCGRRCSEGTQSPCPTELPIVNSTIWNL